MVMLRRSRSPGRPVSLFGRAAVSSSRPAQRNWRRAQGRSRTRAARPTGLVLDGPEHGARLGRGRDAERSLPPAHRRRPLRTQTSDPTKPPPARHPRPARRQAAHSPHRPSNTLIVAPSNIASGLKGARTCAHHDRHRRVLGETIGGLDGQHAHPRLVARRRAGLASDVGGAAHISRNSFASM